MRFTVWLDATSYIAIEEKPGTDVHQIAFCHAWMRGYTWYLMPKNVMPGTILALVEHWLPRRSVAEFERMIRHVIDGDTKYDIFDACMGREPQEMLVWSEGTPIERKP